jgi:hypothetical protein
MTSKAEWTREALERKGFTGWHRFSGLRGKLRAIDGDTGGVYVVYRDKTDEPVWLERGTGGTWRGDPSVTRDELAANWADGAHVVYIGKAKHGQLRNRLRAYCSFGEGGKGRHYGGRLIWQMEASADLLVAWRVIADRSVDPFGVEQEMLRDFRAAYGRLPFANLMGG